MTKTPEALEKRIEQLVREHLAAQQLAARAAVERAFGGAARPQRQAPPESLGHRRPPTEMAAIGDRLYRAVCARPGETMAVLASDLGASVKGLQRPMMHLKNAGQVRSVGQRNMTRYFPMAARS